MDWGALQSENHIKINLKFLNVSIIFSETYIYIYYNSVGCH